MFFLNSGCTICVCSTKAPMKRIRIYDMDGTIVCSLHRYRTIMCEDGAERIDLQYWRDNQHKALDDSLLPFHEQYKQDKECPDTFTVIATARVMNTADWQMVGEKVGAPDHFISRAANDSRSGGLLKILGLKRLFALKQFHGISDIVFYEDNASYLKTVCDYFADKGMTGVYRPSQQGH